jgi:hypothetical protein
MAFKPNGVAALPKPSAFAAMFITIAPIAGWFGGTSGNNLINKGLIRRAINCSPPAFSTTFIKPRNKVMYPIKPIANVTLPLADFRAAWPTLSAGLRYFCKLTSRVFDVEVSDTESVTSASLIMVDLHNA